MHEINSAFYSASTLAFFKVFFFAFVLHFLKHKRNQNEKLHQVYIRFYDLFLKIIKTGTCPTICPLMLHICAKFKSSLGYKQSQETGEVLRSKSLREGEIEKGNEIHREANFDLRVKKQPKNVPR